jgi:hypothetical protein
MSSTFTSTRFFVYRSMSLRRRSTSAPLADHDAGPRRADEHPDLIALALDVDRADAGARQP